IVRKRYEPVAGWFQDHLALGGARNSARCMHRIASPRRDARPAICIRQLESQATTVSAPLRSMLAIFSSPIAPEISGYLTEKVPPNPQQDSDLSISISSEPLTD